MENYEEEIKNYIREISELNQVIKTYEDHNKKISEVEKKIRILKVKHEKEIKEIEAYYKDKITYLSKKLMQRKASNSPFMHHKDKSCKTIEDREFVKKSVNYFNFNKKFFLTLT